MIIRGVCGCRVMVVHAGRTRVGKRSQKNRPIRRLTHGRERVMHFSARITHIMGYGRYGRITGPREDPVGGVDGGKGDSGVMRAGGSRMNSIRDRRRRVCIIRRCGRLGRLMIPQQTLPRSVILCHGGTRQRIEVEVLKLCVSACEDI